MTVKQIQHLLAYLGYYTLAVDGIWGKGSRAALEAFRKNAGLTPGQMPDGAAEAALRRAVAEGEAASSFWEEMEYFTREEFRCKCGLSHAPYCDGFPAEPKQTLVRILEDVRHQFGRPVIIVSGLRCPRHNADSGGVANSQHLVGEAADIRVEGVSPAAVEAFLDRRGGVRYHYTIPGSTHVHLDIPGGSL